MIRDLNRGSNINLIAGRNILFNSEFCNVHAEQQKLRDIAIYTKPHTPRYECICFGLVLHNTITEPVWFSMQFKLYYATHINFFPNLWPKYTKLKSSKLFHAS